MGVASVIVVSVYAAVTETEFVVVAVPATTASGRREPVAAVV